VSGARGIGLLEVLVALVVLAVGVVALERLLARSIAGLGDDVELTRAMMTARTLLAEAELRPPEPGSISGMRAGLAFERDVERTAAPALREVRIRVYPPRGPACELVELLRVPAA
jgi:type II secretion system protein I